MNKNTSSIGLSNPKSPENVSSVMRAAGNYGVGHIFYTGTRYPRALALNPDIPNMSRRISKDIPISGVSCLLESAPQDARIVCVEFAENAIPLPAYQHPENACYIFGPEDGNLSQQIIDRADDVIYVPTRGCMNLAAAVNVVLYDRLAKTLNHPGNNQLIRQSRDTNNRLRVRQKKSITCPE